MSTTTNPTPFGISKTTAAIIYFAAVMVIWLAKWNPPATAPAAINTFVWALGLIAIVAQYELQNLATPTIPPAHAAAFAGFALLIATISGQISASYSSVWYGGFAVALIGAFLAAYAQIGGKTPVAGAPVVVPKS